MDRRNQGWVGKVARFRPWDWWGGGWTALLVGVLFLGGCFGTSSQEVVVYTTLDQSLVEPIFQKFTEKTGIRVEARFPEEGSPEEDLLKTVVDARGRPLCDLVWHGEAVQTIRLRQEGFLAAYHWPNTQRFSNWAKSSDGRWIGLAARARVLLVYGPAFQTQASGQKSPSAAEMPSSVLDLADPKYRGKAAMARPTSGTAAAHVACWFALWGPERAKQFLRQLRQNQVQFLRNEQEVARQVAEGKCFLALTDSDQAIREVEKGSPVLLLYPDQREEQSGAIYFPTTIALLRQAAHPHAACQLADYLVSPEVETRLANGPAAHVPLNYEVTAISRIKSPDQVKAIKVDFEAAANQWDAAVQFVRQEILQEKP